MSLGINSQQPLPLPDRLLFNCFITDALWHLDHTVFQVSSVDYEILASRVAQPTVVHCRDLSPERPLLDPALVDRTGGCFDIMVARNARGRNIGLT